MQLANKIMKLKRPIKLEVEICSDDLTLFDEGYDVVELECDYSVDEEDDGSRYPIEEVFIWDKSKYTEAENAMIAIRVEECTETLRDEHYQNWLWQCAANREDYELRNV